MLSLMFYGDMGVKRKAERPRNKVSENIDMKLNSRFATDQLYSALG